MSSDGMCHHNNITGYCPSCVKEKEMRQYKSQMGRGGMGATCAPGYYDLKILGVSTGQCVPNLATVTSGAGAGAAGSLATGVASSPANLEAARSAAANTLGQKIMNFYFDPVTHKASMMGFGITAAVLVGAIYGIMTFARGK